MTDTPDVDLFDPMFGVTCTSCAHPVVVPAFQFFSVNRIPWTLDCVERGEPFVVDLRTGVYRAPVIPISCPKCGAQLRIALGVWLAEGEIVSQTHMKGAGPNLRIVEGTEVRPDDAGRVPQPAGVGVEDRFAVRRGGLTSVDPPPTEREDAPSEPPE